MSTKFRLEKFEADPVVIVRDVSLIHLAASIGLVLWRYGGLILGGLTLEMLLPALLVWSFYKAARYYFFNRDKKPSLLIASLIFPGLALLPLGAYLLSRIPFDLDDLRTLAFIAFLAFFAVVNLIADTELNYVRLSPRVKHTADLSDAPAVRRWPTALVLILAGSATYFLPSPASLIVLVSASLVLPLLYSCLEVRSPFVHYVAVVRLLAHALYLWFGYPAVKQAGVFSLAHRLLRYVIYGGGVTPLLFYLALTSNGFLYAERVGYLYTIPVALACVLIGVPIVLLAIVFPLFSDVQTLLLWLRSEQAVPNQWEEMVERTMRKEP